MENPMASNEVFPPYLAEIKPLAELECSDDLKIAIGLFT
jgi:hypothetical protein